MSVDSEMLMAIAFLVSPAVSAAVTMLLLKPGGRGNWLAVSLTSLVALLLAFPVGFTVLGPLLVVPSLMLIALIVFGIFVGAVGHTISRTAAHG